MSEIDEPEVTRDQALAGLRVLVQVCRADGVASDEEREALEPSMEALGLAEDEREAILAEDVDLEAALASVTDEAVRREVLLAAEAVARADRIVDPEQAVIARAREAWGLEPQRLSLLDELDKEALREAFRSYRERGEAAYEEQAEAPASDEERWKGRSTDITELTRRFMHGEASAHELARKSKDDIEE